MEKGNGQKRHIPEQRHKDRQLRIQMLNEERVREVGVCVKNSMQKQKNIVNNCCSV